MEKIFLKLKEEYRMRSEATTIDPRINQLPPCLDVLEEIFSHLSGNDLKNCALVCKDWDDVIRAYAVTMKKLKIGFHLHRDQISFGYGYGSREIIIQSSDESGRKYQNMEIRIHDESLKKLTSLDRFNTSRVKSLSLRFKSTGSIELNKVIELLSRMPLLKALEIAFGEDCTIDTTNALAAHFTQLKQLNVRAKGSKDQPINIDIFEFIKAPNVTELTYRDTASHSDAEIDEIAGFIKSKTSLTKLNVTSYVFTRHDFSGMSLELLEMNYYARNNSVIVIEHFSKSLIFNAHSLTSLCIPTWLMTKEILVVIFNRLRKLTTLDIFGYDVDGGSWMDDLSPNDISPNSSLKILKVKHVGTNNGLRTILQRAPQLERLTLGRVADVTIRDVQTSARGIKELKIDSLIEIYAGDQRFIELKSLTIHAIYKFDILASLLQRCPKVEVFECQGFIREDTNSVIDLLLQQKTLKHLRFDFCRPAQRRIIFDKLQSNYGNLRSLRMSSYGKFIMHDFPEDPAEWKVEEQEIRFSDFQVTNPQR